MPEPSRRPYFGITQPGIRIAVWICACVTSAGCMVAFWPLGFVPFLMLALFSAATTHTKGKPWG